MNDQVAKREQGIALHQRLISGDRTVSAEIAELYLPILTNRLSKRFPATDGIHIIDTAVIDAILSYLQRPEQYRPEGMNLENYLFKSAWGDLLNALDSENRYRHIRLGEIVELEDGDLEYIIEPQSTDNVEEEVMINLDGLWQKLQTLFPDAIDQLVLSLMMTGERDTEIFADAMEISHLSVEEKRQAVKRDKDRIKESSITELYT